ncbi:2-C-methyl-D-erythritol 4-phosphate cytidylyltransferase [Patescibacteria group bacterium]|nr:2-C-methyl-D-erythritol 4-phosphate cytidylyltransferase [Patescibacteria group bacterium]
MNVGIILASGIGKRMKAGKNKVLLELRGAPLIFYTLRAFEKCQDIEKILIVIRKEEIELARKIVKKYKVKKVIGIIAGGKERQFSGLNAVIYLDKILKYKTGTIVVFHNGANPFVTAEEIINSLKNAKKYGAAAVAHPTRDTIKEVAKNGLVVKTLERSKLWNMQTPQAIKFPLAHKAFTKAEEDNFIGTDDVSLVERMGGKVKIIEASENNFKITTPQDLALAKIIIKSLKK